MTGNLTLTPSHCGKGTGFLEGKKAGLAAAEVREVAVLVDRQRAGEDRVMLLRAHRDSVDEFRLADLEKSVVGRQHVKLLVIVGIGRPDEHRARSRQHRIAERFEFGAEGSQLPTLNA